MTIKIEFEDFALSRILDTGLSSRSIGYWCKSITEAGRHNSDTLSHNALRRKGVKFVEHENQSGVGGVKPGILNRASIKKGLHLMAWHAPKRFGELYAQKDAADTELCDIFIQFCVFGKVVYG